MERTWMGSVTARAVASGPVAILCPGFITHLRSLGYKLETVRWKLTFIAQLNRWLQRHAMPLRSMEERHLDAFLHSRRRHRRGAAGAAAATRQFLRFARTVGATRRITPVRRTDRNARLIGAYRHHLECERSLAGVTIHSYAGLVEPLLCRDPRVLRHPRTLERFIRSRAGKMSPGRVKLLVTALRSFFRFLHVTGRTDRDLSPSVPTVPDWRHTTLPRAVPVRTVERIVGSCDRSTPRGRRDHAVLLVLARLGLRAGEVVRMSLDDLDWDAGELLVRGKGSRLDRLPLPPEVGAALADYLRDRQARDGTRRLFLTNRAPRRGLAGPAAVSCIVQRAIERSGVSTPTHGAHLLRHSLATELLRRGAPVGEIGELLRHRHPDTTRIYARVDLAALRPLALRWPGGAS